jgi:hypothetical protein
VNLIISEENLGNVNLYLAPPRFPSIRSKSNAMDSHRHGTNVQHTERSHIHPAKEEKGLIGVKPMLAPVWWEEVD